MVPANTFKCIYIRKSIFKSFVGTVKHYFCGSVFYVKVLSFQPNTVALAKTGKYAKFLLACINFCILFISPKQFNFRKTFRR